MPIHEPEYMHEFIVLINLHPGCSIIFLVLSNQVRESLLTRAADFGIILEDVAITHLSFGTEVNGP